METPMTYKGYDKDNVCIVTQQAEDATTYLNPEEVKQAIEHICEVAEEQAVILRKATYHLRGEADHALIISATTMSESISDITDVQDKIVQAITGSFDGVYESAVQARDELQKTLNKAAYDYVASYPGVVRK